MKKALFFASVCAIAAMSMVSCSNKTSNEKQLEGITNADVDSVSYMLGYGLGMSIKYNNIGPMNINQINKGIKDAIKGVEVSQEQYSMVMNSYMEKRTQLQLTANAKIGEEFLANNAKAEGVQVTESGLQYKIVKEGGVKPSATDTVEVNYEGKNLDGEVFDSSYERGETATFPLDRVIPGWTEGMQLVGEGGEIMLWIPASLAYGERAVNEKIGPNSTLIFKVELVKVFPAAAAEAE